MSGRGLCLALGLLEALIPGKDEIHGCTEELRERAIGMAVDLRKDPTTKPGALLFKAELVRNKGPWKNIDDLELAIAEYIDWFNHHRLHGEIGLVPPAEFEEAYYRHHPAPTTVDASVPSLP